MRGPGEHLGTVAGASTSWNVCGSCAYSLDGLSGNPITCPECGAPNEPGAVAERARLGLRLLTWGIGLTALVILLVAAVRPWFPAGASQRDHAVGIAAATALAALPALVGLGGLLLLAGVPVLGRGTRTLLSASSIAAASILALLAAHGVVVQISAAPVEGFPWITPTQIRQALVWILGFLVPVLAGGAGCAVSELCERSGLRASARWCRRVGIVAAPALLLTMVIGEVFAILGGAGAMLEAQRTGTPISAGESINVSYLTVYDLLRLLAYSAAALAAWTIWLSCVLLLDRLRRA